MENKEEVLEPVSAPANEDKFRELRKNAEKNVQVFDEIKEKEAQAAAAKAAKVSAFKESYTLKNTLEVLAFAIALEKAVINAKKNDGKINAADIAELFPVIPLVGPMVEDLHFVPKELGDLDEVEKEVLLMEAAKLIPGETTPAIILRVKAGLKFASAGYDLYKAFSK